MTLFSSLYSALYPVNRAIKAAEAGDLQAVTSYLEKGGNANAVEFNAIDALTKGLMSIFAGVQQNRGRLRRRVGVTALHRAAGKGHTEIVRVLIRQGANVNAQAENGTTPLHWALFNKRGATALLLLEQGADGTKADDKGLTALHLLTTQTLADSESLEIARRLIHSNVDPNAKAAIAPGNYTPLHGAAERGKLELAELLIQNGANVNLKLAGDAFKTPLRLALENNHTEVADLLIRSGADINSTDNFHATLLHWAASDNLLDVASFLLAHGAIISWTDGVGNTPLHLAAQAGHRNVVELLIECGAEADAKTVHGATPLILARQAKHLDIVRLLENCV